MPAEPDPELTRLLADVGQDPEAWADILPHLYGTLREVAARVLGGDHHAGGNYEPTGLVHEAWERLSRREGFRSREHFLAVAAVAMRGLLVDKARAESAEKRGGKARRMTLHSRIADLDTQTIDLLDLDDALQKLAAMDSRQARVIELRTFGGMTVPEIAALLEVAPSTVDLAWRTGRAWLRAQLVGDGA